MRFRAILMDNDGTLMDFRAGEANAIRGILRWLGIADPEAGAVYSAINNRCWKEFEKGLITQPELRVKRFRELLSRYGVTADAEDVACRYEDALSQQSILLPGALNAVKEISSRLPVVILTNGIARTQHGRIDHSPIAPYLSGLLISSETGSPKPAPDMYWQALRMLGGIRPQDALMIGDSLSSDILGAANAGVPACWMNPDRLPRPLDLPIEFEIRSAEEMPSVALMD